jgi:SAM-dependent methyltransferase
MKMPDFDVKDRKTTVGNGVLVGVPTLGRPVPLDWAFALKSMHPPINYNSHNLILHNRPVDEARNEIVENAIRLGSKYVFFLGDDVVCPANTLKQLIYRMEQNPKIGVVGAVYCSKSEPPAPLVFRGNGVGSYWDWKVGEFFSCTGLGMDATLIRVDVFTKLSKPWFKTVDEDGFADGVNHADQWTEDLYFCNKLIEETEYEIWCDGSLICDHWDVYAPNGGRKFTLPSSLPTRRLASEKGRKALDVGCGPVNRSSQFPDFDLVRVDIREECDADYRCDVRTLPFASAEFDLVFSSHVLEHFPRAEWEGVLDEWIRVLKTDGELVLCLPNIKWAVDVLSGAESGAENDVLNVFYGAQSNPYDFHYNGLWPERMKKVLEARGFKKIDFNFQGYNMIINARR